jgi:hypothetical protein
VLVVGCDDDDAVGSGELPHDVENLFDLDVVEVGGRLVGEHE